MFFFTAFSERGGGKRETDRQIEKDRERDRH